MSDFERQPNTQYVLSLSYGKDSLACLAAIDELGLPLDRTPALKYVPGYEGLYIISDIGTVYSCRRGIIMKPDLCKGYLQVTLQKNGTRSRFKVHRLVADAFLGEHDGMDFINHKDEDKTNNRVGNLEWCTAAYNNSYGSRTSKSSETQRANAHNRKDTRSIVCVETGVVYVSAKDAQRKTGICNSCISRCCSGRALSGGGFHWKYV